jgi:hypothetical protein
MALGEQGKVDEWCLWQNREQKNSVVRQPSHMKTSVDDLTIVISEIESKNILNVGCDFYVTVTVYMTILGAGIQENEGNESSS